MPIFSGGSGGGPAAGSYLPVANRSGVTVNTTTYDDPIAGSGKLTTLVFPADQGALAIAKSGDAFPRYLFASDATDGMYFSNGTADPWISGTVIQASGATGLNIGSNGPVNISGAAGQVTIVGLGQTGQPTQAVAVNQVSPYLTVTSGALSTVALSSGVGQFISATADVETVTPVTFNPGAATTATCVVALSPDNTTYSTLGVETEPAGTALDGTIHLIRVRVPVGWFLKLTVNAQATLGTTTYY